MISHFFGIPIAQSRFYLHTLGPKVGIRTFPRVTRIEGDV